VRARIERAGGDPEAVEVLAVTKGFGPDAVVAARRAGLTQVGENYARELEAKRAAYEATGDAPVRWHFMGAIQTNKVRELAAAVDCWQSVSRTVEAVRIARFSPHATVLIQVAFSAGPDRPGCEPDKVASLAGDVARLDLDLVGLMAVAPRPPEEARAAFRTVRLLADDLGLAVRSMGMTEDLELAVAEGSTMLRVGRALFGERPVQTEPMTLDRGPPR
jgi:pyridoxal phosphate enzyme (YggS family)